MRRDIKKQFWFNEKEAGALEEKANATCLTEAALVRLLVTGFIPVSKDNAKIYSLTKELSALGNNIKLQLSVIHSALPKRKGFSKRLMSLTNFNLNSKRSFSHQRLMKDGGK